MLIFKQDLAKDTANKIAMNAQYNDLQQHRQFNSAAMPEMSEELKRALNTAQGMQANAGRKPSDLYREFDSQVVTQFRLDEGDAILNPLMGLARSLPLGRTVLENARASDAGTFTQSMSGEEGSIFAKVDFDFDGTIVPVNVGGYKVNFRQNQQLTLENFEYLSNLQRETLRTHRQGLIGSFMDGHKNKDGSFIKEKGFDWRGVRADSRVDQVDLGAGGLNVDFTSSSLSGQDAKAAFIALTRRRYIDNKVTARATFYVSNEIMFNFMRDYSTEYKDVSIMTVLKRDLGANIVDIVPSSVLTGNQVLSIPMESRFIQPLVGMGVSTIARNRPEWNSPLAFDIVSAVGWKVNTDFGDQGKAIQYAAS